MASYDHDYDRRPHHSSLLGCVWPALLLAVVLAVLFVWFWHRGGSGLNPQADPRPVTPRGDLMAEEKTNIDIYKTASPSVVHVTNLGERRVQFSLDPQRIPKGTGSGFVWDSDGHIVTNYHVVEGAAAAKVVLADHSSHDARQVWAYPEKDIAVIWIDTAKSQLHPILIGSSHDLKVGQMSYAIGNPFGLDQSLTTGVISALGREVSAGDGRPIHGAIQTSAPINPGNSGGPLLDSAGRLIGMNTLIVSPSGAFAGIGFAIPVDEINEIVPQLIRSGKVVRPRLGVQIAEDEMARQLGVEEGALIIKVLPDGPAAKAGLRGTRRNDNGKVQLGDIIVAVGGQPVKAGKDLYTVLEHQKVGDTVAISIIRDSDRQDVQVTLEAAQ
ncbi:MAG: S1C family serine protease [Gemmataceae bacterium]